MEINIDIPIVWDYNFVEWDDISSDIEYDELDDLRIYKRLYKIHLAGEEYTIKTTDPEVVKSYGFVGEQDEWGHYIKWTYNDENASSGYDFKGDSNMSSTGSQKPHGFAYFEKGERDVSLVTISQYNQYTITYRNGVIEESGDLNEQPETPDTPEVPDVPETPDTPEVPDVPETPDTPEVPDVPETPDTPENPEQPKEPVTTIVSGK